MPPGWVFEGSSENGRASRALVRVAPFEPLASGSSVRAVGLPQDGLAAIEGLGISCRRVGLHPAEPQDRKKVSSSNHCFWLCDLKLSMMIWNMTLRTNRCAVGSHLSLWRLRGD